MPRSGSTPMTIAESPSPSRRAADRGTAHAGVLYGIGAYGLWGILPLYFKAIKQVPVLEVLCHRVIWSLVVLIGLLWLRGNWCAAWQALRARRTLLTLAITTLLIGGNWLMFIWAIAHEHVLQASLGYYINPLVNVVLGFVFLRERLRGWQSVAVILAVVGVGYLTIAGGRFPALALFLAVTFGCYGLLRKVVKVDAMLGLTVETAFLTPPALIYLGYQMAHGQAVFLRVSLRMDVLLLAAGVVTAVPLLWFTKAARRLRLATLGFIQYLSPTGHFLLAVLLFGEPFTLMHAITFACIWAALVLYTFPMARLSRGLGDSSLLTESTG